MYFTLSPQTIVRLRDALIHSDYDSVLVSSFASPFSINDQMFSLLEMCDGTNNTEMLSFALNEQETDIKEVVHQLVEIGALLASHVPQKVDISKQMRKRSGDVVACRSAIFHLTRKCNLKCSHCYYLEDQSLQQDFSRSDVELIIGQLADMAVESVTISGGEAALARENFITAITLLDKEAIPIRVNTNGLSSPQLFTDLMNSTDFFRRIQVSLDGSKEFHEQLRRAAGTYEKIIEFVRTMSAAGAMVRVISMYDDQWSSDNAIKCLFTTLNAIGIEEWLIEVPSPVGRNKSHVDERSYDNLLTFARHLKELCITFRPSMRVTINQVYAWPNAASEGKHLDDYMCSHDLGLLSFGPEGVSFCSLFMREFGTEWSGFARPEHDLAGAWNRIATQRVSRRLRDNPACSNCELFSVCQGGCPGHYERADRFSGCDHHSRRLALVKMALD